MQTPTPGHPSSSLSPYLAPQNTGKDGQGGTMVGKSQEQICEHTAATHTIHSQVHAHPTHIYTAPLTRMSPLTLKPPLAHIVPQTPLIPHPHSYPLTPPSSLHTPADLRAHTVSATLQQAPGGALSAGMTWAKYSGTPTSQRTLAGNLLEAGRAGCPESSRACPQEAQGTLFCPPSQASQGHHHMVERGSDGKPQERTHISSGGPGWQSADIWGYLARELQGSRGLGRHKSIQKGN